MHETLLVPLDGSSAAEIVLPYAGEIAARLGAEVTLASVSESSVIDIASLYQSYLERIKEQLQGQIEDYGAKKGARVFNTILLGKPADEILRYADESNASLIVIASRGSSGRGPWLLGNVTAKVLRATSSPVLLIRAGANREAFQQKRLVKRILVPLDGSEVGEAAIPCTEVLAKALGAELVLFQALHPAVTLTYADVAAVPYTQPIADESRRNSAITYLNGVGKQLKERGLNTSSVVDLGTPADQIIDYAKANDIDIIAMSTHGRSGIGRWVFGSVTDKVLHAGDTAILVVRAVRK